MTDKFQVGTRIYYTGDMANHESFGTIVRRNPRTRFAPESVDIQFDNARYEGDEEHMTRGIWLTMFDPAPGRRFWLADEWEADRQRRIREMQEYYSNMQRA